MKALTKKLCGWATVIVIVVAGVLIVAGDDTMMVVGWAAYAMMAGAVVSFVRTVRKRDYQQSFWIFMVFWWCLLYLVK